MRNFNKHYKDSIKVPADPTKKLLDEQEFGAEAERNKKLEAQRQDAWLHDPFTQSLLGHIDQEEIKSFQEAKGMAMSHLLENDAANKKLIELETLDKVRNLILKGNYARTK